MKTSDNLSQTNNFYVCKISSYIQVYYSLVEKQLFCVLPHHWTNVHIYYYQLNVSCDFC